jgi:hypothetical protein
MVLEKRKSFMQKSGTKRSLFRACLFGLWLAGCVGKAAVQEKLLYRESCCCEFNYLATWLAG